MILVYTGVIFFYLSYFLLPLIIYLIWRYPELDPITSLTLTIISLLFLYARFIEPNILRVKSYQVKLKNKNLSPFKIAVFSDLHLGLFTKSWMLKRVVEKINNAKPDLIVMPGDFVWFLQENKIEKNFRFLKNLKAPALAVLGNHDYGNGIEKNVSAELKRCFANYGVKVIDNKIEAINIKNQSIKIVGLTDLNTRKPDYSLTSSLSSNNINLLLTHNPETAYELPKSPIDLIISGHTHGGQIRLWYLRQLAYRYVAKLVYNLDKNLNNFRETQLFISFGVGMTGLPFRFLDPPTVDILEIS